MAVYRVQGPDGKVYKFEGPDGATPAQVEAFAAEHFGRPKEPEAKLDPTAEMSALDKGLAGFGKAFVDGGRGVRQIAAKLGLGDEKAIQAEIDEAKGLDAPLMNTGAGMAGNVLGNVAQAVAVPGGSTIKGAAVVGGLLSGAQPVATGESRLQNTAVGTAAGAGGQAMTKMLGAALRGPTNSLTPQQAALAAKAEALGIDLTPAQKSGNTFLRTVDSVLERMPLTGGKQREKIAEQGRQFTRAVTKTMGANADDIGEGTMAGNKARLSGKYNEIFAGEKIAAADFTPRLALVKAEAERALTPEQFRIVSNKIEDLFAKVKDDGVEGVAYQKWRSSLSTRDGDVKHYLNLARSAVDDAASVNLSPGKMDDFIATNAQYKNMKTIQPLAEKSTNGLASPGLLLERVRAANPNMAYTGAGDIGDLAKIGKEFVKDPIADPGTAQRLMAQALLTGGAAGAGGLTGDPSNMLLYGAASLGGPKLAQALLNRPGMVKYLTEGGMDAAAVNPILLELLKKGSTGLPVAGAIAQ